MKTYLRKKTVYVITNKRIFSFYKEQLNSIDYHIYPFRTVTRHAEGYGTISFSTSSQTNRMFYLRGQLPNQNCFELDNIPDVDRVIRILSGQ